MSFSAEQTAQCTSFCEQHGMSQQYAVIYEKRVSEPQPDLKDPSHKVFVSKHHMLPAYKPQ